VRLASGGTCKSKSHGAFSHTDKDGIPLTR
jgi:hypothetical protein